MQMKIGIIGAAGRMGRALVRNALNHKQAMLAGAVEPAGSDFIGQDAGILAGLPACGNLVHSDVEALIASSDAVIEFTTPAATLANAAITAQHETAHIIGTTGLTAEETKKLQAYAAQTCIMHAHNMSVGVNLLCHLVEQTAAKLGPDVFDIEVLEMHHNQKMDSPSGTALSLGEAAAKGRDVSLEEVACYERVGQVGARPEGEIGFATLRGGDVVGDHSVIFASNQELLTLSHCATNRDVFAAGAVAAALWSAGKAPGYYNMRDVLGL